MPVQQTRFAGAQPQQQNQPTPEEQQAPPMSPIMKQQFHKLVGEYNRYGTALRKAGSLREMSRKLQGLAELAERTVMSEADDWFDAHTIKRNMKELKSYAGDFGKHAVEAEQLLERITALYDDMGRVLERYFEMYDVDADAVQEAKKVGWKPAVGMKPATKPTFGTKKKTVESVILSRFVSATANKLMKEGYVQRAANDINEA
jgi:hypothetical protein